MPSFVIGGTSDVGGYKLLFSALNPAAYYQLRLREFGNKPTVPYRFGDVILAIGDYPLSGDSMQVRYLKIRTPILQLPNVAEWVGAGFSLQLWVQWFANGLDWELWL